jgi:hypothetical protein
MSGYESSEWNSIATRSDVDIANALDAGLQRPAITDVGVSRTVLSTDLGQPDTPSPAEGLQMYAERLKACGFSVDDLRLMMRDNPAKMLEARSPKRSHKAVSG